MKRIIKQFLCLCCAVALALSLAACSGAKLLKHGAFSKEYKDFIRHMTKNPPVSVEFEQYLKPDGFDESKLIVDTDAGRLRELATALAQVEIVERVESAENFAVRYYTFTDENGERFTFEFYGIYLKCEGIFYKTENSMPFISIRPMQEKSGSLLLALDEAHPGRGEESSKMFLAYRELEEMNGALKKLSFGEYELSPTATITAPVSHENFEQVQRVGAETFFNDFEQVKGQDNAYYIFDAQVENGVIVALTYRADVSRNGDSI